MCLREVQLRERARSVTKLLRRAVKPGTRDTRQVELTLRLRTRPGLDFSRSPPSRLMAFCVYSAFILRLFCVYSAFILRFLSAFSPGALSPSEGSSVMEKDWWDAEWRGSETHRLLLCRINLDLCHYQGPTDSPSAAHNLFSRHTARTSSASKSIE